MTPITRPELSSSGPPVPWLYRSRCLKQASVAPRPTQCGNISRCKIGRQDAGKRKSISGNCFAKQRLKSERSNREVGHLGMQQNQIICGVLTGYCCCIRPPVWISHLNGFCASAHHMIVRYHAILCNEETSSRYCRLRFWRPPWRVLAYTVHNCSNGGSTIFHVDSAPQRPVVILDLHLRRIGHAVHEFDGCIGG